ncbi:hypothetical protein FH972_007261 [Carpinus fangiana]|uniref:DUF7950 domain-containing protein n=1 Tax=Carpinus fangiana TaxID=176857 RepID=A0A5N6QUV5_9ROSI|nr:hypothetical protein FH972_007261 [Carpinus fangiana]
MDGGDGWHVSSLGGGSQDKTLINRVMLRFRPIAPKPDTGGSSLPTENKSRSFVSQARTKRKYVRVRKNNNEYKREKMVSEEESEDGVEKTVLTLQLLPDRAQKKKDLDAGDSWSKVDRTADKKSVEDNRNQSPQMWLTDKKWAFGDVDPGSGSDRTAVMAQTRVVESWVTVESVTDTCMDVRGIGCTDMEKIKNLERDTCPGFVSDGFERVKWVNEAYKRMVGQEEEGEGHLPECTVRLVAKERLLTWAYPAFTARVRLQHTWRNQKCCTSKVVPCDVWRMDCGGFAWRLDVKAALSLSL